MKTIIDYRAIKAHSETKLEEKVVASIGFGWQPQGGICVALAGAVTVYVQAMVKHLEPPGIGPK